MIASIVGIDMASGPFVSTGAGEDHSQRKRSHRTEPKEILSGGATL